MKKRFQIITLLVFVSITGHSAVPAPEKLLPDETLGVLTVPDYAKASAAYNANASSQVWRDPALKPFREKLVNKFNEEVIKPLERDLGVKFEDYDLPDLKTVDHIFATSGEKCAWLTDTEGNILCLHQDTRPH